MKPTDEFINQALQKALKQRFDSFEVQPSGRLSSEVLGSVKRSNFSNFKRFSTILILMLTCGIGTLSMFKFWNKPGRIESVKLNSALAKPSRGASSIPIKTGNKTEIKPAKKSHASDRDSFFLIDPRLKPLAFHPVHTLPILVYSRTAKSITPSQLAIERPNRNSGLFPHPIAQENTFEKKAEKEFLTQLSDKLTPIEITRESYSTRSAIDVKKLQPHQLPTARPLSTPTPEIIIQNPTSQVFRTSLSRWQGVFSFTPSNTYQRLTVLPQVHVRYQNFELPSLFSIQTAGFTLHGGVEKRGFQILINYSRFTQNVAYEIALDEYVVQPQGSSAYTVAREGTSQREEVTFQLMGLSLQKKFFLPTRSLSKFYAYTGASLSHDLTTSHNLAWGTLGIGKSWPVAQAAYLSLIPQLSFGLNTVRTNNDAFKNRFYQLGLAVELTFGKN